METIKVSGYVQLKITHADGSIELREGKNLVVTAGQNYIAGRLSSNSAAVISHLACGSSNTAPAKTQTALVGTEHERVSGTVTVTDNTIDISGTFGSGIGTDVTVAEFGVFNASSSGTMLCRWTTSSFTLPSTSTIDVTWRLTFGG